MVYESAIEIYDISTLKVLRQIVCCRDICVYCNNVYLKNGCKGVLSYAKYTFEAEKFSEMLKASLSVPPYKELYYEDVKRIILESGIVGVVDNVTYVDKNHPSFNNNDIIKILKSTFEYQIKGRITHNRNNIYVIHPMCYEYYRNEIDLTAFVYPNEFDDEEDAISKIEL